MIVIGKSVDLESVTQISLGNRCHKNTISDYMTQGEPYSLKKQPIPY